jgi:hypothetical protein
VYSYLLRLWKSGQLTETQLQAAVDKAWITAEQQQIILDTPKTV